MGRFQRLRVVGVAFIAVATVLSVAFGAWALAGGFVLGGATMLGWGAGRVRRVLQRPLTRRTQAIAGNRGIFVLRAVLGSLPCAIVGAVLVLIGRSYAIAQFLGGFFLAWALAFALMFIAIWEAVKPSDVAPT